MKAMILAAGYGTRMQPLTQHTPKPLLKVGKHPLIAHHLMRLAQAGIHEVIINLSYLGDQIKELLGNGNHFNLTITYSEEGAIPLGPGGGIVKALPLLGTQPFLLIAADVWSEFPIATLLEKTEHKAHLVMVPNPDFHSAGDYGIEAGLLTKRLPWFTYSGYSVWHPSIFQDANDDNVTPMGIAPFIEKTLKTNAISGELFQGFWMNLGTPEQLAALNTHLLSFPELN